MSVGSSQILLGLFRDQTWISAVRGRQIAVKAWECTKRAGSLNMARDSHESMSFEQQNDCPSISEQVACKKLLITSCAPVPVPVFSYKALTFENSRIPPHTLAHKHDTRKDISVLCNERGKLETYDILDGHEKFTSNHGSQKVGI